VSGRVLVINAGSTSLKLAVVDAEGRARPVASLDDVPDDVTAVGHRVVHGGARFVRPLVLDAEAERALEALAALAPLHNRPALDAIGAARRAVPERPHVAVFDTAFHASLPAVASAYALPRTVCEKHGLRRYGFHGLSVQWAAEQVGAERLVVCHLGGGCSVTAVRAGRSVDTTMGFTPLEGVPMATRAGSVDPGLLLHLLRRGMGVDELDDLLERRAGLLGMSGVSGSVTELEQRASPDAVAALEHFEYRIATAVGSMAVALGGLDALVFTGGVGEHSARVRERVCERLRFLGARLHPERNRSAVPDDDVADASSSVRIVVVRSREDLVIARAVRALLG
jgi:acetate kinase